MTTKAEKIAAYKLEHPTLKVGSDEIGYTYLSTAEYEATLDKWADDELAAEAKLAKSEADKAALLAKLGITADEARLLLGGN
jgi:hypothetical protein